jgi:carbon-monoxide dehydrogenase large subunit
MSKIVGHSVPRLEDAALIKGAGRFVDDIHFPGMLHACFVRSQYAHALIEKIDAAEALKTKGVVAIWTLDDILPHVSDHLLRTALPSPAYLQTLDRPILAGRETVYVGEALAMVIACDPYVAEDAAEKVQVHYQELPAVTDIREALKDGSPTGRCSRLFLAASWACSFHGDARRCRAL